MPSQVKDIKDFVAKAQRPDARQVTIKKLVNSTKFKVRCQKYLYTLVVSDKSKAEKVKQSLPTTLKKVEIK